MLTLCCKIWRCACAALLIAALLLPAATAETTLPRATNLADTGTRDAVCAVLETAGLANVETFAAWTVDFADAAGGRAGLSAGWEAPEALRADIFACMDGWENSYDFSDANCRITASLLLDGLLQAERPDADYDGTYLMFDLDAIDTGERYAFLREKLALFTTVFGEHLPMDGEAAADVFPRVWQEAGVRVEAETVSLVCVVLSDPLTGSMFVGHTGVLVNCGTRLLFVEKLAFEQPYQATELRDVGELLALLGTRPEYFGEPGEAGPYVYQNGALLGELAPEIAGE